LDTNSSAVSNNLAIHFTIVNQDSGTTANLSSIISSFAGSVIWGVGYNLTPLSSVMTRFRIIFFASGVPQSAFSGDTSVRVWYT